MSSAPRINSLIYTSSRYHLSFFCFVSWFWAFSRTDCRDFIEQALRFSAIHVSVFSTSSALSLLCCMKETILQPPQPPTYSFPTSWRGCKCSVTVRGKKNLNGIVINDWQICWKDFALPIGINPVLIQDLNFHHSIPDFCPYCHSGLENGGITIIKFKSIGSNTTKVPLLSSYTWYAFIPGGPSNFLQKYLSELSFFTRRDTFSSKKSPGKLIILSFTSEFSQMHIHLFAKWIQIGLNQESFYDVWKK